MSKTCRIFGAGDYGGLTLFPAQLDGDLLIAADGGYAWLEAHGLIPHLAVGDFDSLGYLPSSVPTLRHPPEKDDTDMLLAVREGLNRGCGRFLIYGGLGGRLDHTLANLHLLDFLARQGRAGFLIGPGETVTAVHNGTLAFPAGYQGTLSVFAWGGAASGVTLSGLRYPLEGGSLTPTYPLGTSNQFLGGQALVSVAQGTLLVLWTPQPGENLPIHS